MFFFLQDPQPQASEFDIKSYNPRTTINVIQNPYMANSLEDKMTTRGRKDKKNLQNPNHSTSGLKKQQSRHSNAPKRKASFSLSQSKRSKKVLFLCFSVMICMHVIEHQATKILPGRCWDLT